MEEMGNCEVRFYCAFLIFIYSLLVVLSVSPAAFRYKLKEVTN